MIYKHLLYGTIGCVYGHIVYRIIWYMNKKLILKEHMISNDSTTLLMSRNKNNDIINIGTIIGYSLGMLLSHKHLICRT
jgi:hypothetical protein